MGAREIIDETLATLRKQVEAAVREEQLRDQLTGLPNDTALTETVSVLLDKGEDLFWIAFVEIDRFKRVNDEYGYDAADALLKAVADHLSLARNFFPDGAQAFRAHGDEFFLLGRLSDPHRADSVHGALDLVRQTIASIRLPVASRQTHMHCTASVGWVDSRTALADGRTGASLTPRHLRGLLERAVGAAKRSGRNCVIKFSHEVSKLDVFSHRDDCSTCHAAFSVDIPVQDLRQDPIHCPNCAAELERPSRPEPPPTTMQV